MTLSSTIVCCVVTFFSRARVCMVTFSSARMLHGDVFKRDHVTLHRFQARWCCFQVRERYMVTCSSDRVLYGDVLK